MTARRQDPEGTRASRFSLLTGYALAGLLLGLPACGIALSPSPSAASFGADVDAGTALAAADGAVEADVPKVVIVAPDAGSTTVMNSTSASPLCGAPGDGGSASACSPDIDSCSAPADAGVDYDMDGGAGTAEPAFGCHVTATHVEAGAAGAMAVCSPAGHGKPESPCYGSDDCAPGLECVVDAAKGEADSAASAGGVCRRYCCDNTCDEKGSFCDIEYTVSSAVAVPVCVNGHPCELLNDATCGSGLTCQVVDAFTGQVACVTPGVATAGESCETSKCAKGLSCILGYFPARECAQLCYIQNDSCPSGEVCVASAAIPGVASQIGTCTP
jgi:hypothetical protein